MQKLIKTKAIIDGNSKDPIYNAWILIEDSIIRHIGTESDFGSKIREIGLYDLSEYYIMPGLIDCHTHLSIQPNLGDQIGQMRRDFDINLPISLNNIRTDFLSGVTTIRAMGEEHYLDIYIHDQIKNGLIIGPDILPSGIGIASSTGHGAALTTADGVEEIKQLALENIQKGADHLKLFVTGGVSSANTSLDKSAYSIDEIKAAVQVAEANGIYASAHAHGGIGLDMCIEGGVRTIEHGTFVSLSQLERMIKEDRWLITTLSILFDDDGVGGKDAVVPEIYQKLTEAREKAEKNLEGVIRSGVNIAAGTDSMHGKLPKELEYLTKFGATNHFAIQSATKFAAQACRIEDKAGTIEEGKIANLICLANNPLRDISAIKKIEKMFKNGIEVLIEG